MTVQEADQTVEGVSTETGELPEGWELTTIATAFDLNPRKVAADALPADAPVTFVPMPAVDANSGTIATPEQRSFGEVRKGYTSFIEDDVIVAKITPCMENGKAAIARGLTNRHGFGSTEFHVLRPTGAAIPEYVYHFVRQQSVRRAAESQMRGAVGQKRVPPEFFENEPFPLAPLAEQKRIVAQVEALLAKVNAARARLASVPAILRRFRQSVLAAACSGQLTADWREVHPDEEIAASVIKRTRECARHIKTRRGVPETVEPSVGVADVELPETWAMESTAALLHSNVLFDVKDGNHGANHPKRSEFTPEGLPFITAAQVNKYSIDYAGAYKLSGEPLSKLRVGFAEPGDAILTHKGSVGRAAINTIKCVLTPQTTYYRCNTEVLNPYWLIYYFTSIQFYQQLAGVMSQTTRDFVPISEQYTKFILVPPLYEQQEIVRRVDALFALADTIEQRLHAGQKRSDALTHSILRSAFRGELVPTEAELARAEGRDYEPASVPLDRIQAQRESTPSSNGAPRGRKRGQKQVAANTKEGNEPAIDPAKRVAAESNGKVRPAKPATTAPAALSDYSVDELMAAFRAALWGAGEVTETELLREVAGRLGYDRLGKSIRAELQGHLRAAIRRRIVARDGDYVTCPTSIFRSYDADFLAARLKSVMAPGRQYTRDEVLANLATYLGFRHVSDAMREHMKPIFTTAIRQGTLASRGKWLWREN